MLIVGALVFLVRLFHEGPYAIPRQGNLLAGLLSLAIGAWLVRSWFGGHKLLTIISGLTVAASPFVLYFALYATIAEVEETVTLRVSNLSGESVDLRLWIVDIEGATWVTMSHSKAEAHGLQSSKAELLRQGEFKCVQTTQYDERDIVNKAHRARHEKYATQRLAGLIGMFGETAPPGDVALRLDRCVDS
jgi:hypothetical protein